MWWRLSCTYQTQGIIPSKYFRKTKERLTSASGGKMQIEFKIPKAHVCQDNACFKTTFVLVKNITVQFISTVSQTSQLRLTTPTYWRSSPSTSKPMEPLCYMEPSSLLLYTECIISAWELTCPPKLSIRENQEKPLLSKPRMLGLPFRSQEPWNGLKFHFQHNGLWRMKTILYRSRTL